MTLRAGILLAGISIGGLGVATLSPGPNATELYQVMGWWGLLLGGSFSLLGALPASRKDRSRD